MDLFQLPDILAGLESLTVASQLDAAEQLAALLERSPPEQAALLGQFLREAGGVELLLEIIVGDTTPVLTQRVLMVLGNLCSATVDPGADDTKELLRGHSAVEKLSTFLKSVKRTHLVNAGERERCPGGR